VERVALRCGALQRPVLACPCLSLPVLDSALHVQVPIYLRQSTPYMQCSQCRRVADSCQCREQTTPTTPTTSLLLPSAPIRLALFIPRASITTDTSVTSRAQSPQSRRVLYGGTNHRPASLPKTPTCGTRDPRPYPPPQYLPTVLLHNFTPLLHPPPRLNTHSSTDSIPPLFLIHLCSPCPLPSTLAPALRPLCDSCLLSVLCVPRLPSPPLPPPLPFVPLHHHPNALKHHSRFMLTRPTASAVHQRLPSCLLALVSPLFFPSFARHYINPLSISSTEVAAIRRCLLSS